MKRYFLPVLILVVIIAVIWFTHRDVAAPPAVVQMHPHIDGGKAASMPPKGVKPIGHPSSSAQRPLVELRAEPYVINDAALARSHENLPFEIIGGAGTGHVVDREGNVLMESGEEIGIFGIAISPNRQRVLVKGGSTYIVLTPATGDKLQLPERPVGANMFNLSSWYWIDDNTLIGQSVVQAFDKNGKPVTTDNNASETSLFVYDLTTQHLTEVAMPEKYKQALVMVMDVSPDGHVHLALDAPPEGVEPDLGWYKLPAP